MALHDSFAHRQADAGAGEFLPAVQSLKNLENTLGMLGIDAYPIVPD